MSGNGDNSCVFCGSDCRQDATPSPIASPNLSAEPVNKFVQELLGVQVQGSLTSEPSSVEEESPVCQDCLSRVAQAAEWRGQVVEVERDVRSLQRIILKMMRQLRTVQANYVEEMTRLGDTINKRNSENGGERGKRDEQRPQRSVWITGKGDTVRKVVLNAVTELSIIQDDLTTQEDGTSSPSPEVEQEDPGSIVSEVKHEEESLEDLHPESNQQEQIMQDIVKPETETENPAVPLIAAVNIPPDSQEDALYAESIDIAYGIYSENPAKSEPVSSEEKTDSFRLPEIPASRKIQKKIIPYEDRKFSCGFCKKRFLNKQNLQLHTYIHTGERPYKCDLCPSAFSQPASLSRHKDTHSKKMPFKCATCQRRFRRKAHLEEHEEGVHGKIFEKSKVWHKRRRKNLTRTMQT